MTKNKDYPIRLATEADFQNIIEMLTDDEHAKKREYVSDSTLSKYKHAFDMIVNDSNADLYVVTEENKAIGFAQINYLIHLTYQGGTRAQIESVRVHQDYRGKGIGTQFFNYLIDLAKSKGCHLVQLTTDKQRAEALKFYERLGFVNSHHGMKLHFSSEKR